MKFILILLFPVFAFAQASNEMVSFSQASTLGFFLKPGETNVASPQCMTKQAALTKYSLSYAAMSAYADNQLVPRNAWVDGRCIVKVSPTVFKEFMCYNLGASQTIDPHTPSQGLHGNYYQWGRNVVVADATSTTGSIGGWNTTPVADGSWSETTKTSNDPCPVGYRVPILSEWTGLYINNTISRTGPFTNSITNFASATHFGPDVSTKAITFPMAGLRDTNNGTLFFRGERGYYWSSTQSNTNFAWLFLLNGNNNPLTTINERTSAVSIRCIKE